MVDRYINQKMDLNEFLKIILFIFLGYRKIDLLFINTIDVWVQILVVSFLC
jgi:hypothetical protein